MGPFRTSQPASTYRRADTLSRLPLLSFLVITKGKGRPLLKVKSILRRTEEDVYREDLLAYLRQHIGDQRRIDTLATPAVPHLLPSAVEAVGKSAALSGPDPVRLLLPSDKPIKDSKGSHKKLFRHGTKALWYEKARSFLALARSPLPLFAVDVPAAVLSHMALDTAWLDDDDSTSAAAWKVVKEKHQQGQGQTQGQAQGYMNMVRDELRDAWVQSMSGGGEGAGMVWLFGVRDERGFLLHWPTPSTHRG